MRFATMTLWLVLGWSHGAVAEIPHGERTESESSVETNPLDFSQTEIDWLVLAMDPRQGTLLAKQVLEMPTAILARWIAILEISVEPPGALARPTWKAQRNALLNKLDREHTRRISASSPKLPQGEKELRKTKGEIEAQRHRLFQEITQKQKTMEKWAGAASAVRKRLGFVSTSDASERLRQARAHRDLARWEVESTHFVALKETLADLDLALLSMRTRLYGENWENNPSLFDSDRDRSVRHSIPLDLSMDAFKRRLARLPYSDASKLKAYLAEAARAHDRKGLRHRKRDIEEREKWVQARLSLGVDPGEEMLSLLSTRPKPLGTQTELGTDWEKFNPYEANLRRAWELLGTLDRQKIRRQWFKRFETSNLFDEKERILQAFLKLNRAFPKDPSALQLPILLYAKRKPILSGDEKHFRNGNAGHLDDFLRDPKILLARAGSSIEQSGVAYRYLNEERKAVGALPSGNKWATPFETARASLLSNLLKAADVGLPHPFLEEFSKGSRKLYANYGDIPVAGLIHLATLAQQKEAEAHQAFGPQARQKVAATFAPVYQTLAALLVRQAKDDREATKLRYQPGFLDWKGKFAAKKDRVDPQYARARALVLENLLLSLKKYQGTHSRPKGEFTPFRPLDQAFGLPPVIDTALVTASKDWLTEYRMHRAELDGNQARPLERQMRRATAIKLQQKLLQNMTANEQRSKQFQEKRRAGKLGGQWEQLRRLLDFENWKFDHFDPFNPNPKLVARDPNSAVVSHIGALQDPFDSLPWVKIAKSKGYNDTTIARLAKIEDRIQKIKKALALVDTRGSGVSGAFQVNSHRLRSDPQFRDLKGLPWYRGRTLNPVQFLTVSQAQAILGGLRAGREDIFAMEPGGWGETALTFYRKNPTLVLAVAAGGLVVSVGLAPGAAAAGGTTAVGFSYATEFVEWLDGTWEPDQHRTGMAFLMGVYAGPVLGGLGKGGLLLYPFLAVSNGSEAWEAGKRGEVAKTALLTAETVLPVLPFLVHRPTRLAAIHGGRRFAGQVKDVVGTSASALVRDARGPLPFLLKTLGKTRHSQQLAGIRARATAAEKVLGRPLGTQGILAVEWASALPNQGEQKALLLKLGFSKSDFLTLHRAGVLGKKPPPLPLAHNTKANAPPTPPPPKEIRSPGHGKYGVKIKPYQPGTPSEPVLNATANRVDAYSDSHLGRTDFHYGLKKDQLSELKRRLLGEGHKSIGKSRPNVWIPKGGDTKKGSPIELTTKRNKDGTYNVTVKHRWKTGDVTSWQAVRTDEVKELLRNYLGKGYREFSKGIWRSVDGKRQVRMVKNDKTGEHGLGAGDMHLDNQPHLHLEKLQWIPDPKNPNKGSLKIRTNVHLPLIGKNIAIRSYKGQKLTEGSQKVVNHFQETGTLPKNTNIQLLVHKDNRVKRTAAQNYVGRRLGNIGDYKGTGLNDGFWRRLPTTSDKPIHSYIWGHKFVGYRQYEPNWSLEKNWGWIRQQMKNRAIFYVRGGNPAFNPKTQTTRHIDGGPSVTWQEYLRILGDPDNRYASVTVWSKNGKKVELLVPTEVRIPSGRVAPPPFSGPKNKSTAGVPPKASLSPDASTAEASHALRSKSLALAQGAKPKLTVASFLRRFKERHNTIQKSHIDDLINNLHKEFPHLSRTYIRHVVSESTQWAQPGYLLDVLRGVHGEVYVGNQPGLGKSLRYLRQKGDEFKYNNSYSNLTQLPPGGTGTLVVDNLLLAHLKKHPLLVDRIKNSKLKLLVLDGWDQSNFLIQHQLTDGRAAQRFRLLLRKIQKSHPTLDHLQKDPAWLTDLQILPKIKALGLENPVFRFRNPIVRPEGGHSSGDIAARFHLVGSSQLSPEQLLSRKIPRIFHPDRNGMANYLKKFPDGKRIRLKLLDKYFTFVTPHRFSKDLKMANKRIQKIAKKNKVKPEDVYYVIPAQGKSQDLINHQHALVNGVSPDRFLGLEEINSLRAAHPNRKFAFVLLDDASLSGDQLSIWTNIVRGRAESSLGKGVSPSLTVALPLYATDIAGKSIRGKAGSANVVYTRIHSIPVPETTIPFGRLDPRQAASVRTSLGEGNYGRTATFFSNYYMSPDNNVRGLKDFIRSLLFHPYGYK